MEMSDSSQVATQMATKSIHTRTRLWVLAVVAICTGCGPTRSTVTGVVSVDGKPLTLATDARGTVVFQPVGGQGAVAMGILDSSGHFELATGARSEVAPGKYQVAISIVELVPHTGESEQAGKRVSPAKYSSAIDSGLQAEVVPGENDFKFDLSTADEPLEIVPSVPRGVGQAPVETGNLPDNTTGGANHDPLKEETTAPSDQNGQ
jgi:hypothetical protein